MASVNKSIQTISTCNHGKHVGLSIILKFDVKRQVQWAPQLDSNTLFFRRRLPAKLAKTGSHTPILFKKIAFDTGRIMTEIDWNQC